MQSRLVALADTTDVVGHLFRKELKNISTPFFLVNRCTEQVLLEKKMERKIEKKTTKTDRSVPGATRGRGQTNLAVGGA